MRASKKIYSAHNLLAIEDRRPGTASAAPKRESGQYSTRSIEGDAAVEQAFAIVEKSQGRI